MTKQNSLKEDLQVEYDIAGGNASYFLLSRPNHLQNLTVICNISNVFWTFHVKGGSNDIIFSIGFQMLKSSFFRWL